MKISLLGLSFFVATSTAFSQAVNPPPIAPILPPNPGQGTDNSNGFDLGKSPQQLPENNSRLPERPQGNVIIKQLPTRPVTTLQKCQSMNLSAPTFRITRVRSGPGFLSGTYKVEGELEGTCIDKAGYYESGQLVESLGADYAPISTRHQFQVNVRVNHFGELKIRLTDGSETKISSEELAAQSESLF